MPWAVGRIVLGDSPVGLQQPGGTKLAKLLSICRRIKTLLRRARNVNVVPRPTKVRHNPGFTGVCRCDFDRLESQLAQHERERTRQALGPSLPALKSRPYVIVPLGIRRHDACNSHELLVCNLDEPCFPCILADF